jgi:hypothetical protein
MALRRNETQNKYTKFVHSVFQSIITFSLNIYFRKRYDFLYGITISICFHIVTQL